MINNMQLWTTEGLEQFVLDWADASQTRQDVADKHERSMASCDNQANAMKLPRRPLAAKPPGGTYAVRGEAVETLNDKRAAEINAEAIRKYWLGKGHIVDVTIERISVQGHHPTYSAKIWTPISAPRRAQRRVG